MKKISNNRIFYFSIILTLSFFVVSCATEDPTNLTILVLDGNGGRVSDATVQVIADPNTNDTTKRNSLNSDINKKGKTNSNGSITFDFEDQFELGMAGFAVLDVRASKDTLVNEITTQIEAQKKNKDTIQLVP
ncbi:MAG: hypothetical protein ABEH43_10710 [Flavobacteriales bacterium]